MIREPLSPGVVHAHPSKERFYSLSPQTRRQLASLVSRTFKQADLLQHRLPQRAQYSLIKELYLKL